MLVNCKKSCDQCFTGNFSINFNQKALESFSHKNLLNAGGATTTPKPGWLYKNDFTANNYNYNYFNFYLKAEISVPHYLQ